LELYRWPGNVRELENTIQRASVLATADVLLPKDIPLGQLTSSPEAAARSSGIEGAVEELFEAACSDSSFALLPWLEKEFTERAMVRAGQNQVHAAKLLGISRATLRKRLERNGSESQDE